MNALRLVACGLLAVTCATANAAQTTVADVPLNATCVKSTDDNGRPIFVNSITEFDASIRGAEAGGEFGIAVPLKSDQFVVFRFSGRGATDATTAARTRPATAPAKAGGNQLL